MAALILLLTHSIAAPAFGWVHQLVQTESSSSSAPAPSGFERALCKWQIRLSQVPSACYKMERSREGESPFDRHCLRAVSIPESIEMNVLSPRCRQWAEKLSRIAKYRGLKKAWPEN